jgi:hypothetical protein
VPAVIQFVVFFSSFFSKIFVPEFIFLANPDLVHGLFLVILYQQAKRGFAAKAFFCNVFSKGG